MCGILFSSYVAFSMPFFIFSFILCTAPFLYLSIRAKIREQENISFYIVFLAAIILFFLGIFRFAAQDNALDNSKLSHYEGKSVSAIGTVIDEPARKGSFLSYRLKVKGISFDGEADPISGEYILAQSSFYNELLYGDQIIVSGSLEREKNIKNEDGATFDYVSYLKKDGVLFEMKRPEVEIVSHDKGNPLISILLHMKNWFNENISGNLGEPDAALASGMVIAGKGTLTKDLQNDFIKSGIIHIVVLSGYNISIIIAVLLSVFSFTGKKIKIIIVGLGVFLFVIVSGGSAPVVRSAIMALTLLLSKNSSRNVSVLRALTFSAFLMALLNPFILVFDPSFGLSFLSTFAVITVAPILKNKFIFVTEKFKLREIISETLGTQIFLLPYLVYQMGIISFVALPVNILVLPLVPPIMFFSFFVGILGFISYLAFPFALFAHLLISLMLLIVKIFISIPFSSISMSHISIWIPILFYFLFFMALIWYRKSDIKEM